MDPRSPSSRWDSPGPVLLQGATHCSRGICAQGSAPSGHHACLAPQLTAPGRLRSSPAPPGTPSPRLQTSPPAELLLQPLSGLQREPVVSQTFAERKPHSTA